MKKLLLTLALCMGYLCTTVAQTFVKTEVKQSMRRVADWRLLITQGYLRCLIG